MRGCDSSSHAGHISAQDLAFSIIVVTATIVAVVMIRVGSKKFEYGPGTIFAGFPSSLGFGVGGQSYSNFLAAAAAQLRLLRLLSFIWRDHCGRSGRSGCSGCSQAPPDARLSRACRRRALGLAFT